MNEWTTEWPKQNGWYWLATKEKYQTDDRTEEFSDLATVEVAYVKETSKWLYLSGGKFIYPEVFEEREIRALWKKMKPEFPSDFEEYFK